MILFISSRAVPPIPQIFCALYNSKSCLIFQSRMGINYSIRKTKSDLLYNIFWATLSKLKTHECQFLTLFIYFITFSFLNRISNVKVCSKIQKACLQICNPIKSFAQAENEIYKVNKSLVNLIETWALFQNKKLNHFFF